MAISNSENGEVPHQMVFHYLQQDNVLNCEYQGGEIVFGQLIGFVNAEGHIDMRYQQINKKGELRTGTCISTPERMPNGKIRLHENWQWTSGTCEKGQSILEEI